MVYALVLEYIQSQHIMSMVSAACVPRYLNLTNLPLPVGNTVRAGAFRIQPSLC